MDKVLARKVAGVPLVLTVLVAGLVGGGLAAFMLSRQVNMTMEVVALWGMTLYDVDHVTELGAITLGNFYRGDSILFPGGADSYTLKNEGDMELYFSYTVSGLSTGVTLAMEYKRNGGEWEGITPNSIKATPLAPGDSIEWRFTVSVSAEAAFTTSAPQIVWNAYDTPTG